MSFLFETHDVMVPTTEWVLARLDEQRGGWVHGATGSGKSHAVRAAVKEGLSIDVAPGPLLGQRFVVDLARQIGHAGRKVLETVRREGLAAALAFAALSMTGRALVVDSAEHLIGTTAGLDDPAAALLQEDRATVRAWLTGRVEQTPTFLVGRRSPEGVTSTYRHRAPTEWPIKLREAATGVRDWPGLAKLAKNNPAALTLARALVPLLPASAFNALVEEAKEDEASVAVLLQRLGQAFQSSAPPSWQKVLAILDALGGVPRDVLEPVLAGRASPQDQALVTPSEERAALDRLQELKLVEERAGLLVPLPALADADAIRPLGPHERTTVLPMAAHTLLASINELRSLEPKDADRVFRAHAIFVDLGDMPSAERTASLHVHGLVALARRTSVQEQDYPEAWRQYDNLLRMLQSGAFCTSDRSGAQLSSYVRHYRAWNGAQAGLLDDAACLEEYAEALARWPENALWHQRYIEGLIHLGRLVDARRAVSEGYQQVEEHPRRDELLRVRPAKAALSAKASYLFSLELIEPVLDASPDLYPEVADGRRAILQRWAHGLLVSELPYHFANSDAEGRVVLHEETRVSARRADGPVAAPEGPGETKDTWIARLHGVTKEGRAEKPLAAIEALARDLGDETRRLVSTPSARLGSKDQRLKGRYLSLVDALNSDIGLEHATERWLVGRIEGTALVPTMRHLPRVEIPEALRPESVEGLYFAKVPVLRDGAPSGPATELRPAGRSLSPDALLEMLARMSEPAA